MGRTGEKEGAGIVVAVHCAEKGTRASVKQGREGRSTGRAIHGGEDDDGG